MERVLVIAPSPTFPPRSGSQQRTALLARSLARRFEVDILCTMPGEGDSAGEVLPEFVSSRWFGPLTRMEPTARSPIGRVAALLLRIPSGRALTFGFDADPELAGLVRSLARERNYRWFIPRYLVSIAQCGLTGATNVVADVDDLPEEGHLGTGVIANLRKIGLRRVSRRVSSGCRHLWVANPDHTRLFPNASCLPNVPYACAMGKPAEPWRKGPNPVVLFVGLLSYGPNQEAVRAFANEIWPKVRMEVPAARFEVVGGGCPQDLQRDLEKTPGICMRGYVEDLREAYRECRAVVAPIRRGSGTSIKVLEAMYESRPSVVTRFAARGLSDAVRDGETALVADDVAAFANRVVQLLTDDELAERLATAAGARVRQTHGFAKFERAVNDTFASLEGIQDA